MADAVRVTGLADLNRALRRTSKEVRVGIRKELRGVAEPVRSESEVLATARIRNIGPPTREASWSRMRIGVLTDVVYVAPKQRGSRGGPRSRRKFAGLLMVRAMQPALEHHAADAEREVDEMLGRVCNRFSIG